MRLANIRLSRRYNYNSFIILWVFVDLGVYYLYAIIDTIWSKYTVLPVNGTVYSETAFCI